MAQTAIAPSRSSPFLHQPSAPPNEATVADALRHTSHGVCNPLFPATEEVPTIEHADAALIEASQQLVVVKSSAVNVPSASPNRRDRADRR